MGPSTTTPTMPAAAGWKLSPSDRWSCNNVCSAEGLSCSEAELRDHDAEVNTDSKIRSFMGAFGKSCYRVFYQTSYDVAPSLYKSCGTDSCTDYCYASPSDRAVEYSCTAKRYGHFRLCWCL